MHIPKSRALASSQRLCRGALETKLPLLQARTLVSDWGWENVSTHAGSYWRASPPPSSVLLYHLGRTQCRSIPGGNPCSWSDSVLRTTSLPCTDFCPKATGALDISIPSSSTSSGSFALLWNPSASSVVVLYGPVLPSCRSGKELWAPASDVFLVQPQLPSDSPLSSGRCTLATGSGDTWCAQRGLLTRSEVCLPGAASAWMPSSMFASRLASIVSRLRFFPCSPLFAVSCPTATKVFARTCHQKRTLKMFQYRIPKSNRIAAGLRGPFGS